MFRAGTADGRSDAYPAERFETLFVEGQNRTRHTTARQSVDEDQHFASARVIHEVEGGPTDVEQLHLIVELILKLQA